MQNRYLPYILILPSVVFLSFFFLYPFVMVARLAFFSGEGVFGVAQFGMVFSHWKFPTALSNTLWLTAVVVPVQLALALLMSTMVNKMGKGRDWVLYIWTIPLGISDLAAGIIWFSIFEQSGFLNTMLGMFGQAQPTALLSYQNLSMVFVAIALAEIWRATAIMLVILVAGMGLIPKEYYEAAEVFGAGPWQRFCKITLPLLRPSLQTALILRVILAFEVFAVVSALSGTLFPVLMGETYRYQFELLKPGAAAAIAMVILGLSLGFTLLILRLLKVPPGVKI